MHHAGHRQLENPVKETRKLTIYQDGTLEFTHDYVVPDIIADLPRLGIAWSLAKGFNDMEWFGHGPGESYNDRHLGSHLGRYESTVRDRYVPYIMPQEHGNIHQLRWLCLRQQDGTGLLFSMEEPCAGKATQVSDAVLTAARHTPDVSFSEHTTVHLDVHQRGLGTKSCGPDTLEQYRLGAGTHSLKYRIMPLAADNDPGKKHRL